MIITNSQNTPEYSFKGYDARRLKGFVMNSNYAGIASDMKKIGDAEGFKVYLFSGTAGSPRLMTEGFRMENTPIGCWAQDMWGIVKNTLLSCEDTKKSEILKDILNIKSNPIQTKARERIGLRQLKDSITAMVKAPLVVRKDGCKFELGNGSFLSSKSYDAEIKTNKSIYNDLCRKTHIKGGNYFITKGCDGKDELLIGSSELKKFNLEELKEMFRIDKIHVIPQADYHLDLFIRPLDNKKVLVADDEMMLERLTEGYEKIKSAINELPDLEKVKFSDVLYGMSLVKERFQNILKVNPYANTKEVEKTLVEAGYDVIKVPGRIFELEKEYNPIGSKTYLRPLLNYLNANVHINDKGELIYITNNSIMDYEMGLTSDIQKLTGFSLKKAFWEAVKPHVSKVYFVSGQNNSVQKTLLREYLGGIHCVAAELPL